MILAITSAFILGILGSTHCIGMCGPIALSLPTINQTLGSRFWGSFLYNIGRVVTYSIIGLCIGLMGNYIALAGAQNAFSITMGAVILCFLLFPFINHLIGSKNIFSSFYNHIRLLIIKVFSRKKYSSFFIIGLLNGLLPCGLVYIAMAGALTTDGLLKSMAFMGFFGLGTLPLMWAVAFFGNFATTKIRKVFKLTYPIIVFTMACMLILRGMGINILHPNPNSSSSIHQAVIECLH